MPGRHGKQRTKKKKSRREVKSQMERQVADSYFARQRKERDILSGLMPKKFVPMKQRLATPSITLPAPDETTEQQQAAVKVDKNKETIQAASAERTPKPSGRAVGATPAKSTVEKVAAAKSSAKKGRKSAQVA